MLRHKIRMAINALRFFTFLPLSLLPIIAPLTRDFTKPDGNITAPTSITLAQRDMPLSDRWPDRWVNQVFADNILLALAYLEGQNPSRNVNWSQIEKPFQFQFKLDPNQTFAFHNDVLPNYQGRIEKTSPAHFTADQGFKSDGYLFGDGVCHLASLIYWAAKDAGLDAVAPTNHNFAKIADVPKEYGVAIYANPYTKGSSALQNLYITNNKEKPITFKFAYANDEVKVAIVEDN